MWRLPKRAADLLSDDDSAQRRRNDGVALNGAQFFREPTANVSGDLCVLEKEGALEELPAVQTGAQNEMPVEQRAGFAEKREEIVAHDSENDADSSLMYRSI